MWLTLIRGQNSIPRSPNPERIPSDASAETGIGAGSDGGRLEPGRSSDWRGADGQPTRGEQPRDDTDRRTSHDEDEGGTEERDGIAGRGRQSEECAQRERLFFQTLEIRDKAVHIFL